MLKTIILALLRRNERSLFKQLADLPREVRIKVEQFAFEELISAESLAEIGKIEKMQGYQGFYKLRFGDYRVGLTFVDGVVTIKTVMHRKEIYKFFP